MLTQVLRRAHTVLGTQLRRNFGVSAAVAQQADPIQQLFLDKIRDYGKKSKAAAGGLVDATADVQQSLKDTLDRIDSAYGAKNQDFSKFPTFSFTEPTLQTVGVTGEPKAEEAAEGVEVSEVDPEKPYWEA